MNIHTGDVFLKLKSELCNGGDVLEISSSPTMEDVALNFEVI
jgi:hypothetical protein